MAKLYLQAGDDLVGAFKTVAANPNTNVVLNGTPVSNQTLMSLAANQAMQGSTSVNSVVPYAGTNFTGMSNNLGAQPITLNPSTLALSNSPTITAAQQSAANQPTVVPYSSSVIPSVSAGTNFTGMSNNLGAQAVTLSDVANSPSQQSVANQATVTPAELTDAQKAAALVASNADANLTKPSTDTLANLGGTGTVVDGNKINTQGNTGTQGSLNPYNTMDATGATPEKVVTPPVTPPVTGLTLADLQKQGYLTNDQLQSSLSANQTALTKQNEKFLTDWGTQADTWKAGVLTDVDTKNQAFGRQATQGFMDAFKNYQLPTNTAGVNMGNYNDNRTTAGDQWWSQYVTGRR